MLPLPRLHHHDITTIVELLHRARAHFNTDKKKALALALTLTVTLRPDHPATRHC